MTPSLRTLNISRPPRERARDLLAYLWQCEEEVLVLTETGWGAGTALIEDVCRAAGFATFSSLREPADARRAGVDATSLGVLLVDRGAGLTRLDVPGPSLLAERVLVAQVPDGVGPGAEPVRLVAVYGAASDPVRYANAVQRQRKRDWLLAFLTWLSELPPAPTILVGDLNIVAPGHVDRLLYVLGEERTAYGLLTGGLGYRDPLAGDPEPTWVDHSGAACRYDYALTTAPLPVGECAIDHTPRLCGLTDHAALAWRTPG